MKWICSIGLPIAVFCVLSMPLAGQGKKSQAPAKNAVVLSPEDSTIQSLQGESVGFFELWNKIWKFSQTKVWEGTDGHDYLPPIRQNRERETYQHCHAPGYAGANESRVKLPGEYAPVRGKTAFSVCPTWLLSDNDEYIKGLRTSETDDVDATIALKLTDAVRTARSALIQHFDSAQRLLPASSAITGQRVRFLVDQQLIDSAFVVARTCAGDATFCFLVQGYVEYRRGRVKEASRLFDSATTKMAPAERCGWRDVANLMPDSIRANYALLSCTPRLQFAARYWWLSNPLYSAPVNERSVENDARAVQMMLRTALPRDERFLYWKKEYDPEALTKLVLRYGWPTYLAWGGKELDDSHNGWLTGFHTDSQAPYTTYEYSKGRVHTAPSLAAMYSLFSVADSTFDLSDPNPKDRAANWWPTEFMARTRPLVTLPSYQIAMLRRDSSVLLASGHDLRAPMFDALRAGGNATLMVTPAPDTIIKLGAKYVDNAETVRMRASIRSGFTIFALEISDSLPLGMDARTRVAINPPATLSEMKPGEIALSDPIVLQIRKGETSALEPSEDLLNQMLGSTTVSLAENARLGVMFESYGVKAGDTVGVSVTLRRNEKLSGFRRLGMAINVAGDPNGSVTIAWKEPNAAHVTRTISGMVPIQSRAIVLDISALTPGPYEMVIGLKRATQPEVTSTRRVTIVK